MFRNPFEPLTPTEQAVLDVIVADALAEWDELGWCPYCGERDVAMHCLTYHPEMWRGGPLVYGTVWHGWSDR